MAAKCLKDFGQRPYLSSYSQQKQEETEVETETFEWEIKENMREAEQNCLAGKNQKRFVSTNRAHKETKSTTCLQGK